MSHCASRAPAIAAAARSALTLKPCEPFASVAIGETTGTFPAATSSFSADGSTEVMTPTSPRSAEVPSTRCVRGCATRTPEDLPEMATALTP